MKIIKFLKDNFLYNIIISSLIFNIILGIEWFNMNKHINNMKLRAIDMPLVECYGWQDIEFILFKRELENLYSDGTLELDYKSCEMMADDLADYIYEKYPHRDFVITVSEDGENGAICHYPRNSNGVH